MLRETCLVHLQSSQPEPQTRCRCLAGSIALAAADGPDTWLVLPAAVYPCSVPGKNHRQLLSTGNSNGPGVWQTSDRRQAGPGISMPSGSTVGIDLAARGVDGRHHRAGQHQRGSGRLPVSAGKRPAEQKRTSGAKLPQHLGKPEEYPAISAKPADRDHLQPLSSGPLRHAGIQPGDDLSVMCGGRPLSCQPGQSLQMPDGGFLSALVPVRKILGKADPQSENAGQNQLVPVSIMPA